MKSHTLQDEVIFNFLYLFVYRVHVNSYDRIQIIYSFPKLIL